MDREQTVYQSLLKAVAGKNYPSLRLLATMSGLSPHSKAQTMAYLQRLEDKGLVVKLDGTWLPKVSVEAAIAEVGKGAE